LLKCLSAETAFHRLPGLDGGAEVVAIGSILQEGLSGIGEVAQVGEFVAVDLRHVKHPRLVDYLLESWAGGISPGQGRDSIQDGGVATHRDS